jgi:hypothetical protein
MYSQPGIFNVLDYGMVPNDMSVAEANAEALQNTINAAQAFCNSVPGEPCGAIILIPSNDTIPVEGSPASDGDGGTYYIALPASQTSDIVSFSCYCPLLFLGTGNGTTLMVVQNSSQLYGNLFGIDIANTSDQNIGGFSFQDFQIQYASGASFSPTVAAFHVRQGRNIRLFRMILIDCPIGLNLQGSLQASVIDCEIQNNLNPGTPIALGNTPNSAKETYVAGCILDAIGEAYGTGVGLSISDAEQVRIVNTRIDSFQQGIVISPNGGNVLHLSFENVSVFATSIGTATAGGALVIQPTSGGSVTQTVFVGCEFTPSPTGSGGYSGSGILISGSGAIVDQVRLVSCYSCTWPAAGLEVNGATNIEVLGGYYSCNGTSESLPNELPAGIALTASAGDSAGVRVVGVACNNSILNSAESVPGGEQATQQFGIYVENSVWLISNVIIDSCDLSGNLAFGVGIDASATSEGPGITELFVRGCNLTGNHSGAVQALGTPNAQITDCAGYNDQAKVLGTIAGGSITNTRYNYYGPIAFYVSGGNVSQITIDGSATGLKSGGFTLGPGESGQITFGIPPPSFLVVGK